MKKVNKFNYKGELLKSYKSLAEASKDAGVTIETISMVCNGKRKTAAGYLWSFNSTIDICEKIDEENWTDIKGFEGQYQISENRVIRRLPYEIEQKDAYGKTYKRHFAGGIVKQWIDTEGYYAVAINGGSYRIHWLYYNTFIGDSNGYIIDHIDRNRLNNDPSNLRLLDYKGNNKNRKMPYKPCIINYNKYYQKKHNGSVSKPFMLQFVENGVRKTYWFATYDEAENKYKELYNERQKRIDDSSKILTINS